MWIIYSRQKSDKMVVGRAISYFSKYEHQKVKEVPSHMAIVFGQRFMLEAVGSSGVRLNFISTFLKHNEVLEVFDYEKGKRLQLQDKKLIVEAADKYHGSKYDYLGVFWFLWHVIKRRWFKIPLPSKNKLNGHNKFFCNELLEFVEDEDQETLTPNDQMLALRDRTTDYHRIYSKRRGDDWCEFWQPYQDKLNSYIKR